MTKLGHQFAPKISPGNKFEGQVVANGRSRQTAFRYPGRGDRGKCDKTAQNVTLGSRLRSALKPTAASLLVTLAHTKALVNVASHRNGKTLWFRESAVPLRFGRTDPYLPRLAEGHVGFLSAHVHASFGP